MFKTSFLAVALASMVAGPALAQQIVATAPSPDIVRVAVSFADLDLTREAGLDRLYARIRTAARKVCGKDTSMISLEERSVTHLCFRDSLARANNDIGVVLARVKQGTSVASLPPIKVSRR